MRFMLMQATLCGLLTLSLAVPVQAQQQLLAPDGADQDHFGGAVSVSAKGDTAVVGARSHDTPDFSDTGSAYWLAPR
jgi:hypothetical protein